MRRLGGNRNCSDNASREKSRKQKGHELAAGNTLVWGGICLSARGPCQKPCSSMDEMEMRNRWLLASYTVAAESNHPFSLARDASFIERTCRARAARTENAARCDQERTRARPARLLAVGCFRVPVISDFWTSQKKPPTLLDRANYFKRSLLGKYFLSNYFSRNKTHNYFLIIKKKTPFVKIKKNISCNCL